MKELINETLSLIDRLIYFEQFQDRSLMVMPDNHGEIIIPVNGSIEVNVLGSARSIQLKESHAYYISPRRRAMITRGNEGTRFALIKLNPIYNKLFTNKEDGRLTGIYNWPDGQSLAMWLVTYTKENLITEASNKLHHLLDSCEEADQLNDMLMDSIDMIKNNHGSITIKEIYTQLGVSKSKLEQHFNYEIGMTPKEFCKIEKINHFISSYFIRGGNSLTELTYQCGYYDQSHLIKDFKYFTDTSPKRFFNSQFV